MGKKQPRRGRPQVDQITDAQRRALTEIRDFIADHGYPPSMSELGSSLHVTAASAHRLVKQLERKGYVKRQARKARSLTIRIDVSQQIGSLVAVPLVGVAKAGPAMLAEENRLGEVLVDERIVKRDRCFALRVSGDSMVGAGMNDGDIVICRQQPVAENGEIVVALIDDEATLKRLSIREDRIELRAENKKYRPISIDAESDFRILGKVLAIQSNVDE